MGHFNMRTVFIDTLKYEIMFIILLQYVFGLDFKMYTTQSL